MDLGAVRGAVAAYLQISQGIGPTGPQGDAGEVFTSGSINVDDVYLGVFAEDKPAEQPAAGATAAKPADTAAPAAAATTSATAATPATPPPNKGDTAWMIVATAFVILMTIPCLALFYAGMVRTKNSLSASAGCDWVFTHIFILPSSSHFPAFAIRRASSPSSSRTSNRPLPVTPRLPQRRTGLRTKGRDAGHPPVPSSFGPDPDLCLP